MFTHLSTTKISTREILKQFNLLIHAGEAKSVAPLSAILGQFGLNCTEFCQKFNEESIKSYELGTPLLVRFSVLTERRFDFLILRVMLNKLLRSKIIIGGYGIRRAIRKVDLYRLFILTQNIEPAIKFKNVMGSLKSIKVKKII